MADQVDELGQAFTLKIVFMCQPVAQAPEFQPGCGVGKDMLRGSPSDDVVEAAAFLCEHAVRMSQSGSHLVLQFGETLHDGSDAFAGGGIYRLLLLGAIAPVTSAVHLASAEGLETAGRAGSAAV